MILKKKRKKKKKKMMMMMMMGMRRKRRVGARAETLQEQWPQERKSSTLAHRSNGSQKQR